MFKSIQFTSQTLQRIAHSRKKSTQLVNTVINNEGINIITMQNNSVNALTREFLNELQTALENAEKNKVPGVVLTSSFQRVFSAGLDINELYNPNHKRFKEYWSHFKDVLLTLNKLEMPNVALINGHALAGGCLLAMSCEYRVMKSGFTIGMNETKLGITVPEWGHAVFSSVTTQRQAELALTSGAIYTSEEALTLGVVNEIANDNVDALNRCNRFFKRFDKVNPAARSITKNATKRKVLELLTKNREEDSEAFYANINTPAVQELIKVIIKK